MILGMVFVLAIPIVLNLFIFDANSGQSNNPPTEEDKRSDSNQNNQEKDKQYWGVDSASQTDEDLYQCVKDNYDKPQIWGRYLGDKEGVSNGLDDDEVSYLHDKNVKILVIYNHFTDATGYEHGVKEAERAIEYAKELGIPDGVALFGDIEPNFPVNSAFIDGWYDTLADSAYKPAIYGVFDEGSALVEAYNAANQETKENTIVWTAFPQGEITTKENAPEYNPQGPKGSMLYGWQYALEAEKCTIDTNLFEEEMLKFLW